MIKLKKMINELTFVRYGSLTPAVQAGYSSGEGKFHSPPAKKGIYAFVKGSANKYLVTGPNRSFIEQSTGLDAKWEFILDKKGNPIEAPLPNLDGFDEEEILAGREEYGNKFGLEDDEMDSQELSGRYGVTFPEGDDLNIYEDEKTGKLYYVGLKKPISFNYSGKIWHHLKKYVSPTDILKGKDDWVLTTTDAHEKAYEKAVASKDTGKFDDYLEVFIEKI